MVWNTKKEHYYTKSPTSKLRERKIYTVLRGNELVFHTGSGVFSPDRIDLGTRLLIEKSIVKRDQKILDFGCGYGALGIALSKAIPDLKTTMSDINERAVMLAKKNIEENKIKAKAIQSDIFENVKGKFDVILLNPPQTAGKKICFRMIEESKNHLNKNGSLQMVARHQKGGKSFQTKMEETFGNVKVIARGSGYRIYYSELKL